MVKKRTSGGGLGVILAQHFDTGIDLVRRLTGEFVARFDKIGTDNDPQIVTGTIGRRMGSFLMQLVASPSTRPAYGHLWGLGGVAAIHNGDGTATPILDAWANKDTDIAALTVDVGTQSVSAGDFGVIMRGTNDDAQSLVFFKGSGGAGGGASGSFYGDGSDGSLTVPLDTTSWANLGRGVQAAAGSGLPYGIANGTYVWGIPKFSGESSNHRDLWCTDLTIPSGAILASAGCAACIIHCTGTLTVDGELTAGGDAFGFLNGRSTSGPWITAQNLLGGAGGVNSDGGGGRGNAQISAIPYDEGPLIPDTTKQSGNGGNDSSGHNIGHGLGKGVPPARPGDGGAGSANGSSSWLRTFPGAATGCQNSIGSTVPNTTSACSGGGGGGVIGGDGGASGALLIICAKNITGTGKITCNGGRGLTGDPLGVATGGGGGGGNPGGISIVTENLDLTGGLTLSHTPGAGGAGSSAGGSAGTAAGGVGWGQIMNPSTGSVSTF